MKRSALLLVLSGLLAAQQPDPQPRPRCGLQHPPTPLGAGVDNPDCDYFQTNPAGAYAPTSLLRIPVVVHVIRASNGTTGHLSAALVQSQITVLNEDFRAISGTPGANGVDSQIEFFLATEDPNAQPTTGILYYNNTTWFNDGGGYYNSIAWDTSRYLNIYTNTASGALGYVPDLPQGGSVLGTTADRVVVYYGAVGRPGLAGPPYDRGRTATHEVGHFFGLFHTFHGGCAGGSCYTGGDRICDTNAESQPRFGCPTSAVSCGSLDPVRNYMDYTDDTCMQGFTAEQVRRMRCTLQHYRPQLAVPASVLPSATPRAGAGNFNAAFDATPPRVGQNVTFTVTTSGTGYTSASVYAFASPGNEPFGGQTILVDRTTSQLFVLPTQVNAVCVWVVSVPNNAALTGLTLSTQALLPGSPPGLTNAMDLVVGN